MSISIGWLSKQFPDLQGLELIGRGGQKVAYGCQHLALGRCVLKVLAIGTNRVMREIEAVSCISGANVPQIHESGSADSDVGPVLWLLEQYVDGTSLAGLLGRGPLSKGLVLRVAEDITAAAAAAEAVKVVHRDIKPDNVIVQCDGSAWLLDFGIARVLDLDSLTATSAPRGPHTPGYGAPEQFRYRKRDIDGRADLFAIGVLMCEMATGVNPLRDGTSDPEEMRRRTETLLPLRPEAAWDTDGRLRDFVTAATQRYPHQRPPNCAYALAWVRELAH